MMNTKMPAAINKITLNAATFSGETVQPTYINFFYGSNGTGKSTIAAEISSDSGLVWQEGKSASDYSVLVYNQEFIDANFQGYGNLKGVFTVGERNIEIQNSIVEKTRQKSETDTELSKCITEKNKKTEAKSSLLSTFQDNCWNRAKAIREAFDSTQGGYKRKAQFAERVLQIATPIQHDIEAMKALYETAFDSNACTYREFKSLGGVSRLLGSRGNELLQNPITSSGDSPLLGLSKPSKPPTGYGRVMSASQALMETAHIASKNCPTILSASSPLASMPNTKNISRYFGSSMTFTPPICRTSSKH